MDWTLNEFAREDVIKLFSADVVLQIDNDDENVEPEIIEITEENEGEVFEKYGNWFVFEVRPAIQKTEIEDFEESIGFVSISTHLVMKIELTKESMSKKFEREDVDYGSISKEN